MAINANPIARVTPADAAADGTGLLKIEVNTTVGAGTAQSVFFYWKNMNADVPFDPSFMVATRVWGYYNTQMGANDAARISLAESQSIIPTSSNGVGTLDKTRNRIARALWNDC